MAESCPNGCQSLLPTQLLPGFLQFSFDLFRFPSLLLEQSFLCEVQGFFGLLTFSHVTKCHHRAQEMVLFIFDRGADVSNREARPIWTSFSTVCTVPS